jgi:hypothetical protein
MVFLHIHQCDSYTANRYVILIGVAQRRTLYVATSRIKPEIYLATDRRAIH